MWWVWRQVCRLRSLQCYLQTDRRNSMCVGNELLAMVFFPAIDSMCWCMGILLKRAVHCSPFALPRGIGTMTFYPCKRFFSSASSGDEVEKKESVCMHRTAMSTPSMPDATTFPSLLNKIIQRTKRSQAEIFISFPFSSITQHATQTAECLTPFEKARTRAIAS